MAREIKIKNHKFIKKALDIKTVLEGLNYGYGVMDENCRMAEWDSVGNGLVTIYDRDHIGRGVEIVDINNKKESELSLPMPATSYDVDVLYTLAGPEIAVATTKAYSAQLAAMDALAAQLREMKRGG